MKRQFSIPLAFVLCPTAVVCATIVWPSNLSWGLLAVAALPVLPSFRAEFDDPADREANDDD